MKRWRGACATASATVLVVGGLLNLIVPPTVATAGQSRASQPVAATAVPQPRGGTLRVKVGSVPSGTRMVEVRGPGGFRKTLRKSTTMRRLVPGRYRITAATVNTKQFMAKPKISKRKVRVTDRRGALVEVTYPVAVSNDLEVVRPTEVKSFVAPLEEAGRLVSTEVLRPGDIVAADVGASTPQGMLVKVTKVVDSGRTSTYAVIQARIDQALPQGSFDATMTADLAPPVGARTVLRGTASRRGGLGCTAGGGDPSISPEGGIDMQMSGSWGAGAPSVSVTLTPYAEAKVKAFVGAQVACKKEISVFDRSFTPITVMIGPVPFVVVPRLRMLAGADLSINAGLSVDARARIDATLVATASAGGLKTQVKGPTVTRSATVAIQGNANADLYARARFTGEIYGVGGPYGQVRVGARGQADVTANPWWSLEAYAQAGVGVEMEKCAQVLAANLCLSLSAGKDDLIDARYPIANAGGPFRTTTTPTPTPTPTPQPPTGGTPLTIGPLVLTYRSPWTNVTYGAAGPGRDSSALDPTNPAGPMSLVGTVASSSCNTDLASCFVTQTSSYATGAAPQVVIGGRIPDSSARFVGVWGMEGLVWCFSAENVCLAYRHNSGTGSVSPTQALQDLFAGARWL